MAVPKKRRTKQKVRSHRAAAFKLADIARSVCSHCKRPIRPHMVCPHCGYYKGKQVLKIETTAVRRKKKGAPEHRHEEEEVAEEAK